MAEDSGVGNDRPGEESSGREKPAQASGGEQSQQPPREVAENQETDREAEQRGSPQDARTRSKRKQAQEAAREAEQQDRQQRMQARSEREFAQEIGRQQAAAFAGAEFEPDEPTGPLAGHRIRLTETVRGSNIGSEDLVGVQSLVRPKYYASPFDKPFITISSAEAEARYQAQMRRLSMLARADFFRAIALITVVVAIVATPIYAMAAKVSPQAFAAYIAPVTGIAGAVVGYWFGASGQAKSSDSRISSSAGGNTDTFDS
jgi:hypothetical protein